MADKKNKTAENMPENIQGADNPGNKLLVTIVNKGFAEQVVEQSRSQGATGATILHGRGSAGIGGQFLGMSITPEKEIVLIVIKEELASNAMQAIVENSGIASAAGGICFCLPVSHLSKFKNKQV